jgi:hypothetical protein
MKEVNASKIKDGYRGGVDDRRVIKLLDTTRAL